MPATVPGLGKGTVVRIGTGEVPTWLTLARVQDVTMPAQEVDDIEITSQDTTGLDKEFMGGLIDNGSVNFPHLFSDGSDTDVGLLALTPGQNVLVEITPSGVGAETYTWAGYFKSYTRNLPVGDKRMADAGFRLNAQVVAV